jgi:hypothetical protein
VLYLDVVFVRMLDRYDDIVMFGARLGMELPAVVASWFVSGRLLGLMLYEEETVKEGTPSLGNSPEPWRPKRVIRRPT